MLSFLTGYASHSMNLTLNTYYVLALFQVLRGPQDKLDESLFSQRRGHRVTQTYEAMFQTVLSAVLHRGRSSLLWEHTGMPQASAGDPERFPREGMLKGGLRLQEATGK